MAYTMFYMDPDVHVTVDRVYDETHNDEYMIANYGGLYALNSLHGKVINLREVNAIKIKESFGISRDLLLQEQD